MLTNNKKLLLLCLIGLSSQTLHSGLGHFYKAFFLPNVYSIDTHDWHTNIKLYMVHGSTTTGRDSDGLCTPLLDIGGPQNWLYSMQGVPASTRVADLKATADRLIAATQNSGASSQFGKLSFKSKFTLTETYIFLRQNLVKGFFIKGHLPIRDITIDDIVLQDLSPPLGTFSQQNPDWISLKDNIDTILQAYDLDPYATPFKGNYLGDLMLQLGWQGVYKDIDRASIDLLSARFETGISCPTGGTGNPNEAFQVPGGHVKHWGFMAGINLMIGFTSSLRIGILGTYMKFLSKTGVRRMPTATQNRAGFIHLAAGKTLEKLGDHRSIVGFITFMPPFVQNLTLLAALGKQQRSHRTWCPQDTYAFPSEIVNAPGSGTFTMNILHLKAVYKLAYFKKIVPQIELLTDIPISGKHIFNTSIYGGGLGMHINWEF